MKTVFNKKLNLDTTKQPLFFGEDLAVQRYDTMKYPIFDRLCQQQLGFFWRPEEVSLQKDRNDYAQLSESQKFIFTSNLKYQTMLDSVQGRGPCLAFLPFVTNPELEGCQLYINDPMTVGLYPSHDENGELYNGETNPSPFNFDKLVQSLEEVGFYGKAAGFRKVK